MTMKGIFRLNFIFYLVIPLKLLCQSRISCTCGICLFHSYATIVVYGAIFCFFNYTAIAVYLQRRIENCTRKWAIFIENLFNAQINIFFRTQTRFLQQKQAFFQCVFCNAIIIHRFRNALYVPPVSHLRLKTKFYTAIAVLPQIRDIINYLYLLLVKTLRKNANKDFLSYLFCFEKQKRDLALISKTFP